MSPVKGSPMRKQHIWDECSLDGSGASRLDCGLVKAFCEGIAI